MNRYPAFLVLAYVSAACASTPPRSAEDRLDEVRHGDVQTRHQGTQALVPPAPDAVPAPADDPESTSPAEPECSLDLSLPGMMSDIVSNALMRGVKKPEADVRAFLENAETRYATGQDLLRAAARHFGVDEAHLAAEVERFRHCNCKHGPVAVGGRIPSGDSRPEDHAGGCSVDLSLPGMMSDIVSNALMRGVKKPEADVRAFLENAETRYATGQDLLRAAALHFGVDEAHLAAEVERFRHCNCKHGPVAVGGRIPSGDSRPEDHASREDVEVSDFARDVTLHVVLHELGHALIREFDLPLLGNEETMADAFATHFLTTHLPDRAVDVLRARTASLMIEAREVPREEWAVRGEHDNDARRAFQIAALAVASDPAKYEPVAKVVEMSERDIQKARDYGAEIHRSWRRILAPLWMPDGVRSKEARVVSDPESEFSDALGSVGLLAELESIIRRFDWHSQVTIHFTAGDGRAGWNRSERTISVPSEYLQRFLEQGKVARF